MKNRVIYADILRVFATFAVMIIHVSATNFEELKPSSYEWNILNFYDSLARWCVPVFVMLSGMFFLNPNKPVSMKKLYTKSIFRVLLALFFWGFIYELYKRILEHGPFDGNFLKETFVSIFQGETHYHLWFLYMILGLYIVTPIFRIFIKAARKIDIEYFLVIGFLFSSLLPTLERFYPFKYMVPFLINFDVNLVLGYAVYFIMGYYLSEYGFNEKVKKGIYILGILGVLITIIGNSFLSIEKGSPDNFLFYYLRVNVFVTTIALFLFIKDFFKNRDLNKISLSTISIISKYSFGMYLVHDMVRTLLMNAGFYNLSFNPIFSVPILAVSIFIISFFATSFIRKIPYLGERIT
ncbi:acyltransferase [Neobacillus mesonae]|uniref:acyltransferase n=1 Tax=Neobacillus mesonae TaxID=1193713 RepID=UPI002E1DBF1C|nr:acyltransferase family protein [Neobacillus mesonae]MED4206335.1 acyltransferase family protein [Neobacillus mesonae]